MSDEKPKNNEFEKLLVEVKQLRKRFLYTVASYTIFNQLNKIIATNVVGKRKAEENVKILNRYQYFFSVTKEATRCYFLIELAKFFDPPKPQNETRTVHWVLNYANENFHRFTKKDFLSFHNKREFIPELLENYKQLKILDLERFKKRLYRNNNIIQNLKTYRDKELAHDDIKKTSVEIKSKEIKTLVRIVKDVIEFFYYTLDFSSNSYKNFEERPIKEIVKLFKNLTEHEERRLRELIQNI